MSSDVRHGTAGRRQPTDIHSQLCASCPFNAQKHDRTHGDRDVRLAPLHAELADARARAAPDDAESVVSTNSLASSDAYSILSSPATRLINSSSAPSDISESNPDTSQLQAQTRSRRGNTGTQTHEHPERMASARAHTHPCAAGTRLS